ncbi:hypothetical protein Taro_004501 [Colocasia esculenta]|uniref:Uncharacterized protein n=1 Tax=Colocasia esculenta TaxID=4460 RepID=A0A843TKA2_COLES|nr:hypothetical protein [Colocasia esculenta]
MKYLEQYTDEIKELIRMIGCMVKNLKNSGKNLRDPSSPQILLLLASPPGPGTSWHELGPAMRVATHVVWLLYGGEVDGGWHPLIHSFSV